MSNYKTVFSDVVDLTDTTAYFEFDTEGYTGISFAIEYVTGTPSACYVQLQYSVNGRDFDIAKTRKYSDDSLAAITFIDETLREFQTHGRPIAHKKCRLKIKTAESAAATGILTAFLSD